jgi:hypothetical protein
MFELKKLNNSLFIPYENYKEDEVVYIFKNNFNEVEMIPNMIMIKPEGIKYILHKLKDGCLLQYRIIEKYEKGYIFNERNNPVFIPIM